MLSCLNLTPEQTKKIHTLQESFEKDVSPLRIQEFERNAELKMLWMQINPDPENIKTKQREIHDLKLTIEDKATDFRLGFRNILTQEQMLKFLTLTEGLKHLHEGEFRRKPVPGPDRRAPWPPPPPRW